MPKNFAVACLILALGAAVAGAQPAQHDEARDENEAPADQTDDQTEDQAPVSQGSTPRRSPRAVFSGAQTTQRSNKPEQAEVPANPTDDQTEDQQEIQAPVSQGSTLSRSPIGQFEPMRSKLSQPSASGAAGGGSSSKAQSSGAQVRIGSGEYPVPGAVPHNQYNLGFWGGTDVSCSLVSGAMPRGLVIASLKSVSNHSGCAIIGVAHDYVGTYKITWKGTGTELGKKAATTITKSLDIIIIKPDASIHFPSVCAGPLCKICPDATVGELYSCTLGVSTDGDWKGAYIRFRLAWGGGNMGANPHGSGVAGSPGGLEITTHDDSTIVGREPTEAQKTAVVTGIPQKAGTYGLTFCAGFSTKMHMSFCRDPLSPFVVHPARERPGVPSNPSLTIIKTPAVFSMSAGPTPGYVSSGLASENFTLIGTRSDMDPTEYRITVTGSYNSGDSLSPTRRPVLVSNVASFTSRSGAGTYYFTMRACNARGCSGESNTVTYVVTR